MIAEGIWTHTDYQSGIAMVMIETADRTYSLFGDSRMVRYATEALEGGPVWFETEDGVTVEAIGPVG
ncbi:MAG: hypothetical protein IT579_08585 [Verrucomicrobia subdivision 3 bacterium]|nr:hypothetical protein [Limisphaerales bacterium]